MRLGLDTMERSHLRGGARRAYEILSSEEEVTRDLLVTLAQHTSEGSQHQTSGQ